MHSNAVSEDDRYVLLGSYVKQYMSLIYVDIHECSLNLKYKAFRVAALYSLDSKIIILYENKGENAKPLLVSLTCSAKFYFLSYIFQLYFATLFFV